MPFVYNFAVYLLRSEQFGERVRKNSDQVVPVFGQIPAELGDIAADVDSDQILDAIIQKETEFNMIKFAGGTILAAYAYNNLTSRIWPIAYSLVAAEGIYQCIKLYYRIIWTGSYWHHFKFGCSPYDVVTGLLIYLGSYYALRQSLRCNNYVWTPCLLTCAGGLYLAAESLYKVPHVPDEIQKLVKLVYKNTLMTTIKFGGGIILTVCMYNYETNRIWPFAYSLIAAEGIYQFIKFDYKVSDQHRFNCGPLDDGFSPYNVATGTMIYYGSVYAFSEAWRSNNQWIVYLLTAAGGLYLAAQSVSELKRTSKVNIPLKCCQLASVPALIVCGATYLWYFRNINEEWMKWLPLVLIFKTGFLFAAIGTFRKENDEPILLLVKAIELLAGGCLVTVSSAFLAIYFSMKEFHSFWSYFMSVMGFTGVFVILRSFTCFQRYVGMSEEVSSCFYYIARGAVLILLSGLLIICRRNNLLVNFLFPILVGCGHFLIWKSACKLYRMVPRLVFVRYCQLALGPLLTIFSSAASGYVGYHMRWRGSVMMMPLACVGIYATRKRFRSSYQALRYCQKTLGSLLTIYSSAASAYVAYRMGWRYSLMMFPLTCAGIYVAYKGFKRG